jgi:hypothetical protein
MMLLLIAKYPSGDLPLYSVRRVGDACYTRWTLDMEDKGAEARLGGKGDIAGCQVELSLHGQECPVSPLIGGGRYYAAAMSVYSW